MSGGNVLAGGLAGDCVRGTYTAQMGTRWKLQLIDFSNKEGGI